MKAFFSYLEYEELLTENPLSKMKIKFKEPFLLPRTIPFDLIQKMLASAYQEARDTSRDQHKRRLALRDVAVLELLFATGIRVSELCALKADDVDLALGIIKIYGKGAKERIVQIGNADVVEALALYQKA